MSLMSLIRYNDSSIMTCLCKYVYCRSSVTVKISSRLSSESICGAICLYSSLVNTCIVFWSRALCDSSFYSNDISH